ncbi:hypothetical protein GCM10010430_55780 [Kitasatospora cystarginea]|uniref:ER-bound oxygenase mpaB/mpaB'/Rubber oxygenase catalytic domain-containing protein n=1 Tax=Kitasatospora cystarginea TaxID=58350 RepID=A0ABN3EPC0_9ACTN
MRAVHERLRIHDPRSGALHRLDDPDLLLWVHCALVRSNLHAVQRGGLPLRARQADDYVREQRRIAALVGLAPGDAPGSVADLEDYLAGMRPVLTASAEALDIHRFVSRPPLHGPHRALRPSGARPPASATRSCPRGPTTSTAGPVGPQRWRPGCCAPLGPRLCWSRGAPGSASPPAICTRPSNDWDGRPCPPAADCVGAPRLRRLIAASEARFSVGAVIFVAASL